MEGRATVVSPLEEVRSPPQDQSSHFIKVQWATWAQ